MKLTGRKTESVYKRYAIVSEADLSEGIKKLRHCMRGTPERRNNHEPLQFHSNSMARVR